MSTPSIEQLKALHGRPLGELKREERVLLQCYRKGKRHANGLPWIAISFTTSHLHTAALMFAPTRAVADMELIRADAMVHVHIYDRHGDREFPLTLE
ncbi:MAG: hypothetical protein ACREPQ_00825 [Rhodanobacter sp.]